MKYIKLKDKRYALKTILNYGPENNEDKYYIKLHIKEGRRVFNTWVSFNSETERDSELKRLDSSLL